MWKHLIKFSGILLLFFLVACGGNGNTAVLTQPEETEQLNNPAPVQAEPVEAESVNAVEPPATEEELLPVASRPKFIEFYADW